MTYIISTPRVGMVDITDVTTRAPGVAGLPTTALEPFLGEIAVGYDNATAVASGAEFIYLRIPASTAVPLGTVVQWTFATSAPYTVAALPALATSKNTGVSLAVSVNAIASNTSVQYAWFQIQGLTTVLKTAVQATPTNAVVYASATAGRVKLLTSAGGQILGARTANIATVTTTTSTIALYIDRPRMQGQIT